MHKYRLKDIRNFLIHELICLWISYFIVQNEWSWFSNILVENYFTFSFAVVGLCFAIYSLTIPKLIEIKHALKLEAKPFKIIFKEMKFSQYKLWVCFILGFVMMLTVKYFETCSDNKFACISALSILFSTISTSFEILFDTSKSIFIISDLGTVDSDEGSN
ncbi:hypothetical protein HUK80_17790 [Flavobacterium sp. MAH-1]|uniref:Uncharacterized protein n=1 Tax=Flavobacterium agri TaxID=2743471 RepID=A0A7Y9C8U8_9FLAO|nr:hypothetical protein [Flavobacterium agri]NUY82760.1 hypothetical protein [Flavobacterium agri]NYA72783.1 hypothetical protein [Flavobacterium agri]